MIGYLFESIGKKGKFTNHEEEYNNAELLAYESLQLLICLCGS